MIQTYSSTIRRKEMEAVLTCMVDEKIGPGEMKERLVQTIKENMGCDGAVPLRSPSLALEYALKALNIAAGEGVMLSALSPSWQLVCLEKLGYKAIVLDVEEETGLVKLESVQKGIEKGGKVLVLSETMGILPSINDFLALGLPVIEDISQSALSYYPEEYSPEETALKRAKMVKAEQSKGEGESKDEEPLGRRAGMFGSYAILGTESTDIITSGGGAILIAGARKDWIALKAITDFLPSTDIMPDMNAALAIVEIKEFKRNEISREEIFTLYSRAIMSGKHRTFVRGEGRESTVYSFPLVLNSGFKEVKAYVQKKGIEIRPAFENSIIAFQQEKYSGECPCANSLFLRCALFPLYPRLGQKDVSKIVKLLSTLP